MISQKELEKIAEAKNLSLKNCERDYLQDALLFGIYKQIKNELIFKGGTALYKVYNLNRFSEDLDFTLNKAGFEAEKLIKKVLASLFLLNIEGKLIDFSKYRNEINIKIEFKGPLYDGSKTSLTFIPLNISLREKVSFKKETIFTIYKDIPTYEVCVLSIEEILAEKVRAIMTREKPRDVFDFWFLLKRGVEWDIHLINKKLSIYKKKFDKNEFFQKIRAKKNFWETDLKGLMANAPDFEKIKNEITTLLEAKHLSIQP